MKTPKWKGKQQDFLILLSLVDRGQSGTERQILDNIRANNYYYASEKDCEPMKNRHNQPRWEMQFAYRRNYLYQSGFIGKGDGDPVDWYITEKGEKFIKDFAEEIEKFYENLDPNSPGYDSQINT
jgi:hypothetical protein